MLFAGHCDLSRTVTLLATRNGSGVLDMYESRLTLRRLSPRVGLLAGFSFSKSVSQSFKLNENERANIFWLVFDYLVLYLKGEF